jgi:hypothetical protein
MDVKYSEFHADFIFEGTFRKKKCTKIGTVVLKTGFPKNFRSLGKRVLLFSGAIFSNIP